MTERGLILNDIVSKLDPTEVPVEFIIMAQIRDIFGDRHFMQADEFKRVIPDPALNNIAEAKVILNVRKIRQTIVNEVNGIYDQVTKKIHESGMGKN